MAKITKQTIVETLKGLMISADEKAREVAEYVVKTYEENPRLVSLVDLKDTLETIQVMMGAKQVALPIENSLKVNKSNKEIEVKEEAPKKKITKKAPTKTEEELLAEIEELEEVEEEEEIVEEIVEEVKPKKITPKKSNEMAIKPQQLLNFPKTIDNSIGELKLRTDIKTIKEVAEICESTRLFIVTYWSKRDLRQFNYDPMQVQSNLPTEFEGDLDIQEIAYASENGIVMSSISIYTEVPFTYTARGFNADEDGIRFMNGVEYQLYELIE